MTTHVAPGSRYGLLPAETDVSWLFVGGCPRSGTTAMAHVLNRDERIVMGVERWKWLGRPPEQLHFAPAIFFNPIARETNGFFDGLYDQLRERWAGGGVRLLGDKNPFYTKHLDALNRAFGGARFVIMLRDLIEVANSFQSRADNPRDRWPARNGYERGLKEWNLALGDVKRFCDAGGADRVFLVDYAQFFAGEREHNEALYRFLRVDMTEAVAEHVETMRREWDERERRGFVLTDQALRALEQGRDAELERWARSRVAHQLT